MEAPRGATVLLGAGASIEAGIPGAVALTAAIGQHIEANVGSQSAVQLPDESSLARIFTHTAEKLLQSDLSCGIMTHGVDVERLFSTVEMLAHGGSLAIAPFIREWERFEPTGGPLDSPQLYAALGQAMLDALQHVLTPTESLDYLEPLLTATAGRRIATLNYDLCVEGAAQGAGVELTDGIQGWTGGFQWDWGQTSDADTARLLKLHGSINWEPVVTELGGAAGAGEQVFRHGSSLRGSGSAALEVPGLVFGAQGKLRADGPFLAMLMEFSRWMEVTDRLVVVGYSFRDKHINRVIVDWLERPQHKTLDVIDPGVPESHIEVVGEPGNLLEDLVNYSTEQNVGCPGPSTWWSRQPTVEFHRKGASVGLARLMGQ